jgi:hypothetical protein
VAVLELDRRRPFTAARARNEGFAHLRQHLGAALRFVQFVDGDCCLEPGWLAAGVRALGGDPALAVVTGTSRERSIAASFYNRLCDIELSTQPGEIEACGGVAMMRADALQAVGGFDSGLAAGEEPELCMRLQRQCWRLWCLPVPMMKHDLAMHSWLQWWRRSARCGKAYAAASWKHRRGPERYRQREIARIVVWGGLLPGLIVAVTAACGPVGLLGFCGHAIPAVRASRWARRRGRRSAESLLYGCACVLAKLPELIGVLQHCAELRIVQPVDDHHLSNTADRRARD